MIVFEGVAEKNLRDLCEENLPQRQQGTKFFLTGQGEVKS